MNGSFADLTLYLDHIPGLVIIDMDGIIIYTNDQCADYFGTTKEKIMGRHIKNDVFPYTQLIDNLYIDEPKLLFYNSNLGIGLSVAVPLFSNGERSGLMEFDVIERSEVLYEFPEKYTKFLDEELKNLKIDVKRVNDLKHSIKSILGTSKAIEKVKEKIVFAAKSNSSVIITGETGTGKELVANAIHNLSERRSRKMIKVNASALPENLAESELFGYEEGAFTGASRKGKKGKFELANNSTLFIDEINHLPLGIQPKLLRALQEREIDHIGGDDSIPVDVRIIVATSEDLKDLIKKKKFREDLYYRFNVIEIFVPPLRDRIEDVEQLVNAKIQELNYALGRHVEGIDRNALSMLKAYDWPGNIRELYNIVERAMNYTRESILTVNDFNVMDLHSMKLSNNFAYMKEGHDLIKEVKNRAERELIFDVLKKFQGNKTKSAEFLGIPRPLLYQKMTRLDLK